MFCKSSKTEPALYKICQILVESRGELITLHVEGLQAFAGGLPLGADNGRLGEGRCNRLTNIPRQINPNRLLPF